MAIIVKTDKTNMLLTAIKRQIDENKIATWSYGSDGDFTHATDQWAGQAWLQPKVYAGELRFGILKTERH